MKSTRPNITFADVGGMEEAKSQIRKIVENQLHPERFGKYGVVRNGILLHGPQGSGKTFWQKRQQESSRSIIGTSKAPNC
jgi:ATP-dependent 26S proteasome regulatory subunit